MSRRRRRRAAGLVVAGLGTAALVALAAVPSDAGPRPTPRVALLPVEASSSPLPVTAAEARRIDALVEGARRSGAAASSEDDLGARLVHDAAQTVRSGGLPAGGQDSALREGVWTGGTARRVSDLEPPSTADGPPVDTLLVVRTSSASGWHATVTRRDAQGHPLAPIVVRQRAGEGRLHFLRLPAVPGQAIQALSVAVEDDAPFEAWVAEDQG